MKKTIYEKEEEKGMYGSILKINSFELGQIMGMIGTEGLSKMNKGFQKKIDRYLKKLYK